MFTCVSRYGQSVLLALALLLSGPSVAADQGPIFKDQQGSAQSLSNYVGDGQFLVVKIWASHCGVCKASMGELVQFQQDFAEEGVRVLGIAVDGVQSRKAVDRFIEQYRVNFPTLMDDGSRAAQVYLEHVQEPWVGGTPTYLVFNPEGQIVGQNYGPLTHAKLLRFIQAQGGLSG